MVEGQFDWCTAGTPRLYLSHSVLSTLRALWRMHSQNVTLRFWRLLPGIHTAPRVV